MCGEYLPEIHSAEPRKGITHEIERPHEFWKPDYGSGADSDTSGILLPYLSWALDIDVFASIEGLQCNGSSTDIRFRDANHCSLPFRGDF
jgi:hypothetical protein